MKILVTGGAGFIGSHLCGALIAQGHDVTCADNLHTGSEANIKGLARHPRFHFLRHDITEPLMLDVDRIYNLACPASPVHYQADPIKTIKTNVLGALNMLELAKRTNARILQASTSEVYGEPAVHPQTEQYRGNVNPIGIRACYDEGKRAAETLFSDFRRVHNTETRILRIFNTYGSNMHANDGRVIPNFIMQALKGEDITIYGDGSQTRSFCYVDDLVGGIVRLMESGFADPVNMGSTEECSVSELSDLIIRLTGSTSKKCFRALPQDDPLQRRPDISLAKRVLGWEPKTPLEEGLRKTIEYFANTGKF